jgi:NAD(P)-dependent dehydrogenase (short-subunit alcohol dehydrogenase family)
MAVVTGAGRGIGEAIAGGLAQAGYRLMLGDVDVDRARHLAARLGADHVATEVDVSHAAMVEELADTAQARFGRLDVWVNNAGLLPAGRLSDQPAELLARTWNVNLGGVVFGCRAALRHMGPQGSGHIVNVASTCAVKPLAGLTLYSATKSAVVALSEGLRRETRGSGVRISAVLPYMVDTPAAAGLRPRVLRPLHPDQVARAVVATVRHPRSRVFVPRPLGWVLPWAALLPDRVRDNLDGLLRMDDLAMGADDAARSSYEAEVARSAAPRLPLEQDPPMRPWLPPRP